jgi:hypothetical protein
VIVTDEPDVALIVAGVSVRVPPWIARVLTVVVPLGLVTVNAGVVATRVVVVTDDEEKPVEATPATASQS